MKYLIMLICFAVRIAMATTGDVLGGEIETNGWVFRLTLDGYTTNGQFNFGWLTNNTGESKVKLNLTKQGFDTNGTAITRPRVIYGTKQLRCPYGTNGQSTANYVVDMTNNGSTLVIRMSLSEWVSAGDSNITCDVQANWYSNNLAITGMTVTNSSTQIYPKTIGKWNEANFQRVTNNSMKLRLSAYNMYGTNYMPVACVKVRSEDAHGHAVTNTITSMSIDSNTNDCNPVVEYIATLDVSGLTQGDIATNNFVAYPWYGDASSVLDTSDGVWSVGQPYYHPLYFKLDQTNAYYTVTAYVNGTNGTSSGVAITTNLDVNNLPAPFFSISQAAAAIAKTNAILRGASGSNCAGGIIVIRGTNAFTGTSGAPPSTRGDTFLTIKSFPGQQAEIINGTGSGNINGLMKLENIKLNSASDGSDPRFVFASVSNLWFLNCTFAVTNSTNDFIDGAGVHWIEGGRVIAMDQGFLQQGSQNTVFEMIRGVRIGDDTGYGAIQGVQPYNVIGCSRDCTNRAPATFIGTSLTGLPQTPQNIVVAFNKFMRLDYYSITFASFYTASVNCSNGAVIVQNLWESVNTNAGDGLLLVHGDGAQTMVTNIMFWNNTTAGAKTSDFYDEVGTSSHHTILCSLYNNLCSDYNLKSDTFSGSSLNGNRRGNWPVLFGTQCYGNGWMEYGAGAPGSFIQEFNGRGSYQPTIIPNSQPVNGSTNTFGFPQYVRDLSWDGIATVPPSGGGNYRMQPNSPILSISNIVQTIPYDLSGKPRNRNAAGAYELQNVTTIGGSAATTVSGNHSTYIIQ